MVRGNRIQPCLLILNCVIFELLAGDARGMLVSLQRDSREASHIQRMARCVAQGLDVPEFLRQHQGTSHHGRHVILPRAS